ncbi:MAG: antibiotic biosynthesis monooxygenase [Muribaculaceae bacterium]|nr:antibiotic biosynthesis monooxygenase [Muribaculaceae bacterium]
MTIGRGECHVTLLNHCISLVLFNLFFSHVATTTLLHHKPKITQRYAIPAFTNIGEWGLHCFLEISDSSLKKKAVETAIELVEYSLHDKGCISYEAFASLTSDNHIEIVETWEDEASLKAHKESEHFKRLVPELESCGTMTLEKFDF